MVQEPLRAELPQRVYGDLVRGVGGGGKGGDVSGLSGRLGALRLARLLMTARRDDCLCDCVVFRISCFRRRKGGWDAARPVLAIQRERLRAQIQDFIPRWKKTFARLRKTCMRYMLASNATRFLDHLPS